MSKVEKKIVDIREYRRKAAETEKSPNREPSAEAAIREMTYHMLIALQHAKKLLH